MHTLPSPGFGLGLRMEHYAGILDGQPAVDWFEALTEAYLVPGGKPLHHLMRVRERYPVAMHGVSLSVGGTAPLDLEYLAQVKALAAHLEPAWISDHLCWTGVAGKNAHGLLPLPFTEEALAHVSSRVRVVQDILGRRILLENVSSYLSFKQSRLTEWEFLRAVAEQSDCLLLLDLSGIYVDSVNQEFDPHTFLDAMPADRIQQVHLAGYENRGEYLVDTHDQPIAEPVWALYFEAVKRFGTVATCIDRSGNVPPLAELENELETARRVAERALTEAA